jgi:hypothetical protein
MVRPAPDQLCHRLSTPTMRKSLIPHYGSVSLYHPNGWVCEPFGFRCPHHPTIAAASPITRMGTHHHTPLLEATALVLLSQTTTRPPLRGIGDPVSWTVPTGDNVISSRPRGDRRGNPAAPSPQGNTTTEALGVPRNRRHQGETPYRPRRYNSDVFPSSAPNYSDVPP